MPGTGHRVFRVGLLTLAVTLLLSGALMGLVTVRELNRSDYGGALVATGLAALLVWSGVRLVRTARSREVRRRPADTGTPGCEPAGAAYGREGTAAPPSRSRRILRVCCSVPLLLSSAFLLVGAVLSLVNGEDGRLTGLLGGFGALAGQYGLRLTGILRPSRDGRSDGTGGGYYGCGGGGCGSGCGG